MGQLIYQEGNDTVVITDKIALGRIVSELKSTGVIFGGKFVKKDGTVSKFNGRFGVAKHVKGGVNCNKAENWTIYDINRKRYMQIIPDSVMELKAFGLIRKLVGDE